MAKSVARKKAPKVKEQSVAVAKTDRNHFLKLSNPAHIMDFGKVLQKHILDNKLYYSFDEKKYPLCGAWKFAGMNFGLLAKPREVIPKHEPGQYVITLYAIRTFQGTKKDGSKYKFDKEVPVLIGFAHDKEIVQEVRARHKITRETLRIFYEYECTVDVTKFDGTVVSTGITSCSNMEATKVGFDKYAIMGQAQTRGISRALRNLLDFVLEAAGMEPTPGEEMDEKFNDASVVEDTSTEDVKTIPSDKAFAALIVRAKTGEDVLQKAMDNLILTEEQIEAIKAAQEEYNKSKQK